MFTSSSCIKPNKENRPEVFDRSFVLQQLEACGTLETVNICRLGYPARMNYQDFTQRYGFNTRLSSCSGLKKFFSKSDEEHQDKHNDDTEETSFYEMVELQMSNSRATISQCASTEHLYRLCARILVCIFPLQDLHDCHAQFGKHKIFLTQIQMDHLEHTRASIIAGLVSKVQAVWRKVFQQRLFQLYRKSALTIQAAWRMHSAQLHFRKVKLSSLKIQKAWRAYKLCCAVKTLAKSSCVIKRSLVSWIRKQRCKTTLQELRLQKHKQISQVEELSQERNITIFTVLPEEMDVECNHVENSISYKLGPASDQMDNKLDNDFSDTCSQCSDDSGVMIKDDIQSLSGDPVIESPPLKKRITSRRDFRIGNGIITCRRLTKPGLRFHVRRSVLRYGHFGDHTEVTLGLADILQDDLD
ncbi:hypothetical protein Btru_053747 [Bulinus truncatus]|nr:hypothetical protein Btru_053747 [Bulinus truncatus]